MTTKICSRKDCQLVGVEQDISNFWFKNKKKGTYRSECKLCVIIQNTKYQQEHKEEISIQKSQYRKDHKEEITAHGMQYREEHKDEIVQYRQDHKEEIAITTAQYRKDHKEEIAEYNAEYKKKRRQNDPSFKINDNFSKAFRKYLKTNNINKNRNSVFKILDYTPDQLREYLYAQFSHPDNLDNGKVWMTPDNQGAYDKKTWDKNDSSTWKWQVDHIKPQSEFECTSLIDPKLKECWALTNLRPYRADLNVKDGVGRVRHTKPRKTK